jgi:hypothetical protein
MEGNSKKQGIIVLILVLVLIIGVAAIYLLLSKNKAKTGNITTPNSQGEDAGIAKPTTTVKIGTKEVSKGNFQKIEGNVIFYEDGGEVSSLPLTTDEIAINCTDQSLATAAELDYKQIKKVKVYNPKTIIGTIPDQEPIVVFASMIGDTFKAHTIAMKTSSCPQ